MTLMSSRIESSSNINSYIGLRDISLSSDIEAIYHFSKSDTYLCVYEGYISLLKPGISHPQIIWIKNTEGRRKIIPLSLRVIICIYDIYISVLDGLTYEEQTYVMGVSQEEAKSELPIINAYVYERDSSSDKNLKLGLILIRSNMSNYFVEIKLSIELENVEVKECLSPVFFSGFSRTQTKELISSIPEPILDIEVMEGYTQLITRNYIWFIGIKDYLHKYETGYRELRIEGVNGDTLILRKRLCDWLSEYQLRNRRVVY